MKTLIAFAFLVTSVSAFAWPERSNLDGVPEDVCKGIRINYEKDTAICTGASNIKVVLSAKPGKNLTSAEHAALGWYTYGSIDMGVVVDADTNQIFSYTRWLLDGSGKKVGVLSIDGWENYEMEDSGRTDARYNMKGEIVWIALKSIH